MEKIDVLAGLKASFPPLFPGAKLEELTHGLMVWKTIMNMRHQGKIPNSCFRRDGRRLLVVRDEFFAWWAERLSEV